MTLIGPETKLNVHSLSAAEERPRRDKDDDMKQFEDFDEKDWWDQPTIRPIVRAV